MAEKNKTIIRTTKIRLSDPEKMAEKIRLQKIIEKRNELKKIRRRYV